MDYAMKSLSLLTPSTLSKCVTAGVTASASMTQHLLSGGASRQRPYRVTNADRSVKKGIMADTLEDLINKVSDSLSVPCISALVLDEDGTGVDVREFFQTLPENTVLMVLEKGQRWTPYPNSLSRVPLNDCTPQHRTDVAKLTFDLYKNNPKDFIGCLNVKATLYGVYSVSYDLRCYAAKKMLKKTKLQTGQSAYVEPFQPTTVLTISSQHGPPQDEEDINELMAQLFLREALRWTIFSMQATGHILLGSSCYIEQLLEEEERVEKSIMLPQQGRIKQLQNMLLGKISY